MEPLTPRYDEQQHGLYYQLIEDALTSDKDVRNIALTGSYGAGKSSILGKVAQKHKEAVYVSLSTLGLSAEASAQGGDVKASTGTTNIIQKEIVKQLLYSERPEVMPGSRYRRSTRLRFARTLSSSALIAALLTVVFFWAGWTSILVGRLPGNIGLWSNLMVFAGLVIVIFAARFVLHNRIQLDKITAGAATITLTNKSGTYFDDYLDEIVYFFERSRKRIVILEDIDRFDNAYIFETLRSLNTLLNGAKQLRGRRIVFVYAIKDSIFDELGIKAARDEGPMQAAPGPALDAADAEIARANRTKFFELVIPVVPFITHRSARDLLIQVMSNIKHEVSGELIDLTARYVADMRLIKNIRNEFAVFKRKIIDEGTLSLSEDGLFAMMLYKNTHLTDFELVRISKSQLDQLYHLGRELVTQNILRLNDEIRALRDELDQGRPAAERSSVLGARLQKHIAWFQRQAGNGQFTVTFAGADLTDARMLTTDFWEQMTSSDAAIGIGVHPGYPYGGAISMTLTRDDLATMLGDPLHAEQWASAHAREINRRIAHAEEARYFLAHADMAGLAAAPQYILKLDGEDKNFSELMAVTLGSDLARSLVSHGFIDRNFTLYTSTFYAERVTAQATNYILKNIDPDVIDMYAPLSDDDVEGILRERGTSVLSQRAALNLNLLDALLPQNVTAAQLILDRVQLYGEEERTFITAYLEHGTERHEAIRLLAGQWPHILVFIIVEAGLTDLTRRVLLNEALLATRATIDYEVTEEVVGCLVDLSAALDVFTGEQASLHAIEVVRRIFRGAGAQVPALAPLSASMRSAIVAAKAYPITRDNLVCALGDERPSLALDAIRAQSEEIYEHVVAHLDAYLSLLTDRDKTVSSAGDLAKVVNDLASVNELLMAGVLRRTHSHTRVADLGQVPDATWRPLAAAGRFPATFENIQRFVAARGVDRSLGVLFEQAGRITDSGAAEESGKRELAVNILNAAKAVPALDLRAALVSTLGLAEPLAAATLTDLSGELLGRLLEESVLADSEESFAALPLEDCEGRLFAIRRSANFSGFVTSALLPGHCVPAVLQDEQISDVLKRSVVERSVEFTTGASMRVLEAVADYGLNHSISLPFSEVTRFADSGVRASLVLRLLQPHLPELSFADLVPLMTSLADEYVKLTQARKRPRLPRTEATLALTERLEQLEVVNSRSETESEIRVNMKDLRP